MTDEQRMREKELRRQAREPWLTFSEKHREHLNTSELFFLREGYEAAWIQRDAEVQALRELLYEIKFKAGMSHINETMEQQQRLLYDISDAARAALAGEKGSSDE